MGNHTEVVVTNIRMPFWSMVVFMIKWAVAAIPAFAILVILVGIASILLHGFGMMWGMG